MMGVLPAAGSSGLHLQRALGASGGRSGSATGVNGTDLTSDEAGFYFADNLAIAIPLGACLSTLSLLTFLGNAMVVHAIRTERKLHTVSNMFILSLAVADLTVGLVVMPVSAVYVLLGDWSLGLAVCQLWLVADYTASTASILNLLILSLDRYWSIRSPLAYLAQRTKKRALAMIALVWALSALWAIPIIGWHQWYNGGTRKHPSHVCETEFSDSVAFKLTTSLANFIVPMCLMVGLYCQIFREIKRRGQIGEIGRSINRVSCAQHRNGSTGGGHGGGASVNGMHSLTDGSFRTTSSSTKSSSGRRFFLKMRQKAEGEEEEEGGVTVVNGVGRSKGKLFQRLLQPLIKRDPFASQVPHLPPEQPLNNNSNCIIKSKTSTTVTSNPLDSTPLPLPPPPDSNILISSPTPPPPPMIRQSASKEGVNSLNNSSQILRDLRLEQLSRDNGHRILRTSPHCRKCTTSTAITLQHNLDQILQATNSPSSCCSKIDDNHAHHCDIPPHHPRRPSASSIGPPNTSRISSSISSLTSPTISLSSSGSGSGSGSPEEDQPPPPPPVGSPTTLASNSIAYYRQLTLIQSPASGNAALLQSASSSCELNNNYNNPESPQQNILSASKSISSCDLSRASSCNRSYAALQGRVADHFEGVNVTVEYIDQEGGGVADGKPNTPTTPLTTSMNGLQDPIATPSLASGLSVTTNTTTMAIAQNTAILPPDIESSRPAPISESDNPKSTTRHNSSKRSCSKKSRKSSSSSSKRKPLKRSPSTISPNSDEIRKESLGIEREHSSSGSRAIPGKCAMCGSELSKSISQSASTFSNVIIEKASESGSVQTTASAQPKLQGNHTLMCPPKHSMASFTNLPVLYVESGGAIKPTSSAAQLSKASSWRSYSSFRFSTKHYFSRPRTDSIAVPANEFCEECACMASAVSAAARHRHALRREESSRLRQEKKAARQLGVILGAFIACWMPYIVTYVVTAYCAHCVSLTVHQVTIWLGYLNSFLNPFLYALCNENFKHAFKKMLGRMPPPQHLSYNYDQQTIAGTANASTTANGTTGSGSGKHLRGAGTGGGGGSGNKSNKIEPKLSLMKMCSVLLVCIK